MLKLIPPGKRKNNKCYLLRGTIGGDSIETSTRTTDRQLAEERKSELEYKLLRKLSQPDEFSFEEAAERYLEYRNPSLREQKAIRRICKVIRKPVRAVVHSDLVEASALLFPKGSAQNKNRWVMRPAASVLHYAANNKWCDWVRVKLFKEPKPPTRAADYDVCNKLIDNAKTEFQILMILWWFYHGDRVGDSCNIKWENIDIKYKTYKMYVSKTDSYRQAPIDPHVLEILKAIYKRNKPAGFVFPWRSRWGVYKWLKPLCEACNVNFTPHMARHAVGTHLNASGASLRSIMDKLGHADAKSSLRYQQGDIEVVRAVSTKLPKMKK